MYWEALVLELWRHADYREERYAAIFLASERRAKGFQSLASVEMYEEMIVTGAWWDYVDGLAAILSQLSFKAETDLTLLYSCIEPSIGSKEFFLQKAIGWALRQYAWTDRHEIGHYVARNAERLSPLSRREALKNIA